MADWRCVQTAEAMTNVKNEGLASILVLQNLSGEGRYCPWVL